MRSQGDFGRQAEGSIASSIGSTHSYAATLRATGQRRTLWSRRVFSGPVKKCQTVDDWLIAYINSGLYSRLTVFTIERHLKFTAENLICEKNSIQNE